MSKTIRDISQEIQDTGFEPSFTEVEKLFTSKIISEFTDDELENFEFAWRKLMKNFKVDTFYNMVVEERKLRASKNGSFVSALVSILGAIGTWFSCS
ncbi:hypothetical protein ACO1KB_02850 [Leptospira interrogans serovar Szwajizak]|uniref:hypothetical protein n=1 Tax=Leptospira interrogans TaxID=173 RepID=UPI000344A2C8|nr:hypothetical protein [Leptospira interrogans]